MLRRDGKAFEVQIHPYGNPDDYEETLWASEWLYSHTANRETKDLIIRFITTWVFDECKFEEATVVEQLDKEIADRPYMFLSSNFAHSIADQLEDVDLNEDVETLNLAVNSALNNEFTRVRAGGEVNSDASLGELYFRISSTGYNWFDIIWQFVYNRQRSVDTVTIKRDEEATGESTYYRHGNKIFDKMPVEEFIMMKGRPVVESMNEDWMLPSDWMKKEFPGYNVDELEEACEDYRGGWISDEAFYEYFLFYNRDQHLLDEIERKYPYWTEEASDIIDEYLIPITLQCDREYVEQYLEDHFTRMDESYDERDSLVAKAAKLAQKYVKTRSAEDFRKLDAFCCDNDIFLQDLDDGVAIEDDTFYFDESLNESYLTEAEDDLDDIELEGEEEEMSADDLPDDETLEDEEQRQDEEEPNEMISKTIQFPILIEGFDADGNAVGMDEEGQEAFAQEYGEAVIEQIEQNKKFILSALNIYDIEVYFDSLDSNSNVVFIVTTGEDIENTTLMGVLKRYFNVAIDPKQTEEGDFTLAPVLDNKFIKVN